jgi:DNA-directed RNA polymerase specialized sigma24 family protein
MMLAMDVTMQTQQETFLRERGKLLNFIRSKVSSAEEAEDIL